MNYRLRFFLWTVPIWLALNGLHARAATEPAGDDTVIFDMDTVKHRPGESTNKEKQKVPNGTVELVEGKFGKAVQFIFTGDLGAGFMTAGVKATPEWDQAAGHSFWVRGDGSTNFGGLELIDRDNYALRYGYCFPLDSRAWTQVFVPWRDLIPGTVLQAIESAPKTP